MNPLDRYCILMFDEMAIEPGLHYDRRNDRIEGFQNCGGSVDKLLADHAMVFMARGIRKKWKQPISFYFTEAGMAAPDIVRNIKDIVRALKGIGLDVIATVCDQHATNVRALRILKEETNMKFKQSNIEQKGLGFFVDDNDIVPLYDTPHLIKGIRNNMLENNIHFVWKKGLQRASWKDVVAMYELDVGDYDTKMLNKLTDQHIYVDKIKKMKVKNATQVFSHRVSSTMRVFSNRGDLDPSAADTADFLLFVDKLFDSLNSITKFAPEDKALRQAVSTESPHTILWSEAIKTLNSVKIISKNGREFVPPTIKNCITTIQGVRYLWMRLNKVGFQYLCTRNLNQDPVEIFFSCIRSHGLRNINPSSSAFIASFKSLIVSNFKMAHSPNANCEEDISDGPLNSLKELLSSCKEDHFPIIDECPVQQFVFSDERSSIALQTHYYLAGYLAKRIIKTTGKCNTCLKDLLSEVDNEEHSLLNARQYSKALLKPNTTYAHTFSKMVEITHSYLPKLCTKENIKQLLRNIIGKFVSCKFNCEKHNVFPLFTHLFLEFYIYCWVSNVNKILKGVDLRNVNDEVKNAALIKYRKLKYKKRQ